MRHPTESVGMLCHANALLTQPMHEAACRLTRVARARLRQRAHKQRVACLVLQAASRLRLALRRVRLRRALLRAQQRVAEEAPKATEMSRTGALEQLAEEMERLKESDTDGMAMTYLKGSLIATYCHESSLIASACRWGGSDSTAMNGH